MSHSTLTATITGLPDDRFKTIRCRLHKAEEESQLWMAPAFYKEKSTTHKIPDFPHYEMELLTGVWNHDYGQKIHWHESEQEMGRHFVCLTCRVPSVDDAKALFELWCLGTAYTMITNEDFIPKLGQVGGNLLDFCEWMKKEHKVFISIIEG